MQEAKHTPGPWTLETVRTSSGICHKIGPFPWRPEKQNHACVYVDYPSHDGSSPVDQELLANARLIAAAPEMKETIDGALRDIGDVLRAWDQPASKEQLEAVERDLRAVLAKATASESGAA